MSVMLTVLSLHVPSSACVVQETLHLSQTWTAVAEWQNEYSAVQNVAFPDLQLQSLQAMGSRIASNLKMEHVESWPVWQDVHVRG